MSRPVAAARPSAPAVHVSYDAGGQLLAGPPVPWNAAAVRVEVRLVLPAAARQKADFTVRIPGLGPVPAESIRPDTADPSVYRVAFRAAVPPASTNAEVLWKHRLLATVPVPVVGEAEFLAGLRVTSPTITVRVGPHAVAAQAFVASQCRGLTAAAVLRSTAGPLAPLAELGLSVTFRADRTGVEEVVRLPLTGPQRMGREALLAAAPPTLPRKAGTLTVTWKAGPHVLCTHAAKGISRAWFAQSVRLSDSRLFNTDGAVGPVFVLASNEPGVAGLLPVTVVGQPAGRLLFKDTVLLTDGPAVFAPGVLPAAEVGEMAGFEVRAGRRAIGAVAVRPVPAAVFDAEGGYKPPPDFAWTPAADDELAERLGKLLGDG